jgi:hypothetical protein
MLGILANKVDERSQTVFLVCTATSLVAALSLGISPTLIFRQIWTMKTCTPTRLRDSRVSHIATLKSLLLSLLVLSPNAEFVYDNLIVAPLTVVNCDVINVTFTVRTSFDQPGLDQDEVAQVYIKQYNATQPVPQVRLVNFTRIKGLTQSNPVTVTLQIQPRDRAVVLQNDADPSASTEVIEFGDLEIFVGGGQPDFYNGGLSAKIQVIANQYNVEQC